MSEFDVDKYRQPWESDEHWTLRKEFIETYYDTFPEDRLLCLAQVYSNVEILGCTYPAAVMYQIRELTKKLKEGNTLKEVKKARTSVHFIKEGHGISSESQPKSKFGKRQNPDNSKETAKLSKLSQSLLSEGREHSIEVKTVSKINSTSAPSVDEGNESQLPCFKFEKNDMLCETFGGPATKMSFEGKNTVTFQLAKQSVQHSQKTYENNELLEKDADVTHQSLKCNNSNITSTDHMSEVLKVLRDIGRLSRGEIVKQRSPVEAIHNAAHKMKSDVEYKIELMPGGLPHEPIFKCVLEINGITVSEVQASSKKKSRIEAAKLACENLTQPSFEIISDANKKLQVMENEKDHSKVCESSANKSVKSSPQNPLNVVRPIKSRLPQSSRQLKETRPQRKTVFDQKLSETFVIMDNTELRQMEGSIAMLSDSAAFSRVPLKFDFEYPPSIPGNPPSLKAVVYLDGNIISTAIGSSKQMAKEAAADIALSKLRKISYTVKVKDEHNDGFIVSKKQVLDITGSSNTVSESNIGCKMLKMMGWSGGGIGKQGNLGISEPVHTQDLRKQGEGLGYSDNQSSKDFSSRIEQIIQEYAKSNSTSDLIFSPEFTKEERKEVHRIATKYGLKNNSKGGKGFSRHVIVSRRFTGQELVAHLLEVGGYTHKYELIPPCNN